MAIERRIIGIIWSGDILSRFGESRQLINERLFGFPVSNFDVVGFTPPVIAESVINPGGEEVAGLWRKMGKCRDAAFSLRFR